MPATKLITIPKELAGQRVDNFLINHFKGVPKSRIYRAIRAGEVRVNKKRVKADYKLQQDDTLRLPPLVVANKSSNIKPSERLIKLLEDNIIYESTGFIILNKPQGIAAHGGSNIANGVVEALRAGDERFSQLNLVHRLDRATSGCLLLAKDRDHLNALNHLIKSKQMAKRYLAFVKGDWPEHTTDIHLQLEKYQLQSGERMVKVSPTGLSAHTTCRVIKRFAVGTLLEAQPITGRTHQLRVHFAALGHPIAGDEKYGDKAFNKSLKQLGLNRMFLHAASLEFYLKKTHEEIAICSCLDNDLSNFLKTLVDL